MICIGGPCHGFLADHDGQIVQVPNVQWKADHPRMPAPPSSIQGERYEIQPIAISQPNLQLEGYCYVWWRLEPSLVAALALGTLIALAMGAKRWPGSRCEARCEVLESEARCEVSDMMNDAEYLRRRSLPTEAVDELKRRCIPLDLAALEYHDTVPTDLGWYAVQEKLGKRQTTIVKLHRFAAGYAPYYCFGPLIARLAGGGA